MVPDSELLRRYAEEGSEAAFAELVARHLGVIYAAAWRQVGDRHAAEDVVQAVFADLARKAGSLCRRPVLLNWLYTSVRFAAAKARRTERRRINREQEIVLMNQEAHGSTDKAIDWDRLGPVVDDALHQLGEEDRSAILLRFFSGLGFADIGQALAVSEDAARKRVERALEKLRGRLAQRGIVSTTAAIGEALAAQAHLSAPTGFAATVAASACAGAGGSVAVGSILMSMSKFQVAVAAGILALGSGVTAIQIESRSSLGTSSPRERTALSADAVSDGAMAHAGNAVPTKGAPEILVSGRAKPTIAGLLAEPDIARRTAAMAELLAAADENELRSMFQELDGAPNSLAKWKLVTATYERWGELAPANALAVVRHLPSPQKLAREDAIFTGWLRTDPAAAWEWARANPSGVSERLAQAMQKLAGRGETATAWQLAESLPNDRVGATTRNMTTNRLIAAAARYDGADLAARALALPADTELHRQNAVSVLGVQLARSDPTAALEFVRQLPAYEAQMAVRLVLSQEASDRSIFGGDAMASSAFVAQLPPGTIGDEVRISSIQAAARTDQNLAAPMVESLPTPELRRSAMLAVSDQVRGELALDWIIRFPDYPNRAAVLRSQLASWGAQDAAAARAYLARPSILTEAERTVLLQLIP